MARGSVVKSVVVVGAIIVVGVALFAVSRMRATARAGPSRPNVLLITLDTTRADRLHCYGYTRETSPNLDALAADGVRFDCAISTSAITPISHASILTGLNPDRHGLRVFYGKTGFFLSEAQPTLATILKSHGWDTGAFVSAYPASQRFGLHWGFNTFESEVAEAVLKEDPTLPLPKDGYWQRKRVASAQRRCDETTDRTLAWLKQAQRPFFLWTHFFDPHDASLVPPEEITKRFGAYPNQPGSLKAIYDPEIFFVDMQIERLLAYLKERGDYENTVIVVVADHGQGLGDHNWFPHRLLYQEQIRLPLIVRIPGGARGKVITPLVRSTDIAPTILDLLQFEPPAPVDGLSLCGLMTDQPEPPRIGYAEALNTLDVHSPDELPAHQQDLLFCVFEQPWKLIYHKEHPENTELYNMADDPHELRNVAAEQPDQKARLVALLEESGAMEIQIVEPASPMDAEGIRKLKSLGYIGDTK